MAVSTKTASHLLAMSLKADAIGEFLYGEGDEWRQASEAVRAAAALLVAAGRQIEERAQRYAIAAGAEA